MTKHIRLRQWIGAGLLASVAVFASAEPARANLVDCFKALAPIEQVGKAAEVSAAAGACLSAASSDPMMALTIAGLSAAAFGGAFSDIDSCNAKANDVAGKLIAEALLSLPLLSADDKKLLQGFVQGSLPISFVDVIAAIPGLNLLPTYIACGCNVAGLPGEFEKIARQYKETVEGCGEFLEDAVSAVATFIGDAGQAYAEAVASPFHNPTGPAPEVPPCYAPVELQAEMWTSKYINGTDYKGCWTYSPVLTCAKGFVIVEKTVAPGDKIYPAGTKLYKCTARCPGPDISYRPGDVCYATTDWYAVDGRCIPAGGSQVCCESGQNLDSSGRCSPACPKTAVYDTQTRACSPCPENAAPAYVNPGQTSIGVCQKCPPGLTGLSGTCAPCPPGQVIWSLDQPPPPACRQTSQGLECDVPEPSADGKPAASDGPPKQAGSRMTTRPGAPSATQPVGAMSARPAAPFGAGGSTATVQHGPLLLPEGKCAPCPDNWTPVYRYDRTKSSFGHCVECPPGTYSRSRQDHTGLSMVGLPPAANAGVCLPLDCPTGTVFRADEPHKCVPTYQAAPVMPGAPAGPTLEATPRPPQVPIVPGVLAVPVPPLATPGAPAAVTAIPKAADPKKCPQGTRLVDGSCVGSSTAKAAAPSLVCPAGQKANAARTACIADAKAKPGVLTLQKPPPPVRAVAPSKPPPRSKPAPVVRVKPPLAVSPKTIAGPEVK